MSATADLLSRKEAAAYLTSLGYRVNHRTLEHWASERRGPRYTRLSWTMVTYKRSDIDEWIKSQTVVMHGDMKP